MSRLIAVILLSILMFPLAAVVYILTFFSYVAINRNRAEEAGLVIAGLATCAFIAVYWLALWHKTVAWTPTRRSLTAASAGGAAVVGLIIGALMAAAVNEDSVEFILCM